MAGSWIILSCVCPIFLAFPGLVFAIAVASILGGGMTNAVLALAVISWPKYARLARSQALTVRQQPYIEAARLSGCSDTEIIFRHLLPSILSPLLVMSALDLGTMLMELAGLSFLGLGAAGSRVGFDDEQQPQYAADGAVGDPGTRCGDFCDGQSVQSFR